MGQKNAFAQKMRMERKIWMDIQRRFTIQQCIDVAEITLNEHFGFGKKRLTAFEEKFRQEIAQFILLALKDDAEDKGINYTKGKLDRRLRKIFKDEGIFFENRYPKEIR